MRALFRNHVVHFFLIGLILFALDRSVSKYFENTERGVIRISDEQIESIRLDFSKQTGYQASQEQLQALVRDAIDEEILVREARRLILDKGDESVRLRLLSKMRALGEGERYSSEDELFRKAYELKLDEDTVIRRHLVHKMRILLAQAAEPESLSDDDVRKYIEQNPQHFAASPKLAFSQVFLSSHKKKKAQNLLARLRDSQASPEMAESLSDPFPLGLHLNGVSENFLKKRFGKAFAARVFASHTDEWIGPLESPFGIHLIRVKERSSRTLQSMEAVRPSVEHSIANERAAARVEENMERLRKLYPARIEVNLERASNASL